MVAHISADVKYSMHKIVFWVVLSSGIGKFAYLTCLQFIASYTSVNTAQELRWCNTELAALVNIKELRPIDLTSCSAMSI